jgi:hypothetical protein
VLSLSAVAGWEASVLASVRGAIGTLDERDRQIERSGLYGEYPAIVGAYIELFDDEESGLEALKRAVFLLWYGAVEPRCLTGIPELPDRLARRTVEELETRARRRSADDEITWMLAWYYHRAPAVFDVWGAGPATAALATSVPADAWRGATVGAAAFRDRGQLGTYWRALTSEGPAAPT